MKRTAVVLALIVGGCTGDGSDIGPDLTRLPDASFKVLIRHADDADAAPLGVSSANFQISGFSSAVASGRSGRADLRLRPSGRRVFTVDATNASAVQGDRLAGYSFAADTSTVEEVPYVVYLPDLVSSLGMALTAGTQAGATLNDSATSGAVVTVNAGTVVGFGGASTATLRTGALAVGQLPGRLPDPAGAGLRLTSRGIYVGPALFRSSPGASLRIPNDLGLPAGAGAELFRLDEATGEWTKAADATVDGGGTLIDSAGGVTVGGLYCFNTAVATGSVLTGSVVDRDGEPLQGVLVRAPQAFTRTSSAGEFTLPAIAAVDGAGASRTVQLVLHGGRDLRPVRSTTSVGLTPGTIDVGTLTLDTGRVTFVRGLLVNRGRADPRRRVRISATNGLSSDQGFADRQARFDFEDIDASGLVSYLLTRLDPRTPDRVLTAEGVFFVGAGQRDFNQRWFFLEQPWIDNVGGDSTTYVVDRLGHGVVDGAAIVRDNGTGDQFHDVTTNGRLFRLDFGEADGQATASLETTSDGKRVLSAFSVRQARTGRVELPIERARRRPLGNFGRFGLALGTIPLIGSERRVKATRLLDREDWFDEVFLGEDLLEDPPVVLAPDAGGNFIVGIPSPAGNLAAVAGSSAGSTFSLEHVWLIPELERLAGSRAQVDLGAGLPANVPFQVFEGIANLDPRLSIMDFAFDLGVELPSGSLVDLVRDVGGNHVSSGTTVTFTLPALVDALDGARHLVGFGGRATVADITVEQRSMIELSAATAPTVSLLPAPVITSPAANGFVSSGGFDVQFTLPADCDYGVVRLRQETTDANGDVVLDWTALVPPGVTSYTFRTLPDPAQTPLAAGNFTLSVRADRIETGRLTELDFPYERIASRFVGLSAAEREVNAVSSVSIPIVIQ